MTYEDEMEAEKPLDPAAERVRRKMVRLLLVGVGTMLVGVMAVLFAVVYKISQPGDSEGMRARSALADGTVIALPAGGRVERIALDGGRALLLVESGGRQSLLVVDLASGGIAARYPIEKSGSEDD